MWFIPFGGSWAKWGRLLPLILALGALTVFLMTENRPYNKAFALSPCQVISNIESLRADSLLVTGYVGSTGEGFFRLKGRTRCTITLCSLTSPPPAGTEVVVRISHGLGKASLVAEKIYTYKGTAANRVGLSVLPIPVILFLFFYEFRLRGWKFIQRRKR